MNRSTTIAFGFLVLAAAGSAPASAQQQPQSAVTAASFDALCKATEGADAKRLENLKATWSRTSAQIGTSVAEKEKETSAAFGQVSSQIDRALPYLRQQQEFNAQTLEADKGDAYEIERSQRHYDLYTDNIELLESVKNTTGLSQDALDRQEEELERLANPNVPGLQWLMWTAHEEILKSFRAWRGKHAELQEAYAQQKELEAAAVKALKCIDGKAKAFGEAKSKALAHLQARAAKLKAEFVKIIKRLKEGVATLEISPGEARELDLKGRKIGKELDSVIRQIEANGGDVDKETNQLVTFYRKSWR